MKIERNPQTASEVLSSMTGSNVDVRPMNEAEFAQESQSVADALDLPGTTDEQLQAQIDDIAQTRKPRHRRISMTAKLLQFRSWGKFTGEDGVTRPSGVYCTLLKADGEYIIALIPFQARMYNAEGIEIGMRKLLKTVNNPAGFQVTENIGRTFKFEGAWKRNEATYGASGKKLSRDEFFVTDITKA